MAIASRPSSPRKPARNSWLLAFFIALAAVPVIVAAALAWLEYKAPSVVKAPEPMWVNPGTIRATTTDGQPVRSKVAIDMAESFAKSSVERRLHQVGLLLQTSLASKSRQELAGREGLEDLSEDMLERLNDYLGKEDIPPARHVAIQELLIGSP